MKNEVTGSMGTSNIVGPKKSVKILVRIVIAGGPKVYSEAENVSNFY